MNYAQLTAAIASAAISYSASHATAQTQNQDGAVLEEVLVTALRRSNATSLSDTPLSVGAITGDDMEARGFTTISDVIAINPGVSSGKTGSMGNTVQIRGVSSVTGDSTVGFYLDDLPYTRVGSNIAPELNPYDLNRVEVLRGPQGTLFGAGSQGGTVRILTHDPDHE